MPNKLIKTIKELKFLRRKSKQNIEIHPIRSHLDRRLEEAKKRMREKPSKSNHVMYHLLKAISSFLGFFV